MYNNDLNKYLTVDFIDWQKLSGKTILISGATGLVGRYLIDLIMLANKKLDINCKVVGLSHSLEKAKKYFNYFDNDLFDYIAQDVSLPIKYEGEIDYIVHLASNTSPSQYVTSPIATITTNVMGSKNLLDLAVNKKSSKFIFVSSFEVYGSVENKSQISENDFGVIDCTRLRSCYPESKRLSENMCIAYSNEKGINTSIVRLSRVFGPTMNPDSTLSLSQFINCGLNATDIVLKSDGKQNYSYNYVGDATTAIIKVLLDGRDCEAYNVSSKKFDCELGVFARYVSNWCKKEVVYDLPDDVEKKGFSNSVMTILDSSKLESLGWFTLENIEKKINDTLDILSDNNERV